LNTLNEERKLRMESTHGGEQRCACLVIELKVVLATLLLLSGGGVKRGKKDRKTKGWDI